MTETHFFMTPEDGLYFVSFLIDAVNAEYVPEKSADPPPFPRYKTLPHVRERMKCDTSYSRFFVLSSQWERFPLVIDEVHANDGQHFFVVAPRYGGPAFDYICARTRIGDGVRWIVSGSFSDYSYYIQDNAFLTDPALYRTFSRPEAMTRTHTEARKYFRRIGCRSTCRETGEAGPWILPGALDEYDSGTWLRIGDCHFQPIAPRRSPPNPSLKRTRFARR